jgi:hypothetical protein
LVINGTERTNKKNMMKKCKDTCQNTLIASGEQNFQGEVLSGFVMKLIEQTRENIKCGRQSRWHCNRFGSKLKPSYCLSTLLEIGKHNDEQNR